VNGSTFTLNQDCGPTDAPLSVPATITTINGNGHTISANDAGAAQFNGGVLQNATPGQTMNFENLTITGPAAGFQQCAGAGAPFVLYGIWFNDASGSVNNVIVDHIFQQQNFQFGSCQTGRAIRADGGGTARTVTIINTKVMDYQKSGFEARGSMTMDVLSNSTAGPPHPLRGCIAQNAITYVGAQGTVAHNTIIGSGDQSPNACPPDDPGPPPVEGQGGNANGTAVLLFGAHDVTVDHNTITGEGTDIGVAVSAGSSGIVISFNQIGRISSVPPDPTGHGIDVDPAAATLICNTFSLWNFNVVGALQIACTPLPSGCEGDPYSAHTPPVEGVTTALDPPVLAWSITAGTVPPGLTLAADGAITGTPTATGTSHFTVQVDDPSSANLLATQDESITIADCTPPTTTTTTTTTNEESGENPSIPESSEPGEAVAPAAVSGTLPRTGGSGTLPLVGLALLADGALITAIAHRARRRRGKAQ
jgi:hypothetical protein